MGTSHGAGAEDAERGDDQLDAVGAQIATWSPGCTPAAITARAGLQRVVCELGVGEPLLTVDDRFTIGEARCVLAQHRRD